METVQFQETTQELESTPLKIYRTAAVIKGGRRFSFGALVVVGDRHGTVGVGYAKAPGVPAAIEKAQKNARKHLIKVPLLEGTLPHPITVRFGASEVKLVPAAPGTGVIAGTTVRSVLELAGVRDCLTKSYGSTNEKNLSKAVMKALTTLRSKKEVARIRGIDIEQSEVERMIEAGRKYAPATPAVKPAKPKEEPAKSGKDGKGGKRGRKGRGKGREEAAQPGQAEATPQAATEEVTPAPAESSPETAPETPATDSTTTPQDGEKSES